MKHKEQDPIEAPIGQMLGNGGWSRPYTFDRVVRLVISIAALVGVIWLVDVLRDVLLPFLVAWLIAYFLEPFVQYNRRILHLQRRVIPVFVTLIELALIIILLGVFFMPSVVEEMQQLGDLISKYASGQGSVSFIPDNFHTYLRNTLDLESLAAHLTKENIDSMLDTVGGVLSGGYDLVMWVFNWFVMLLYVIFIMLDYERLLHGLRRIVPPKHRDGTLAILNDVKNSMNHYFRGQALIASIVGVCFSIGFLIVGLPLAVVLGLFIGLLNMVPYLQLISLIPTTLLCLVCTVNTGVNFWTMWWSCMLVYIIVQCFQDLYLTPRIMGKAMGLNPALILLSLSIWGTLLGFIGLIIALPLTTLILAYYNRYLTFKEDQLSQQQS